MKNTQAAIAALQRAVGFDLIAGREVSHLTLANHTVSASGVGLPGISLPAGLSRSGLPFGLELDAPLGRDRALLRLAHRIEGVLGIQPSPI